MTFTKLWAGLRGTPGEACGAVAVGPRTCQHLLGMCALGTAPRGGEVAVLRPPRKDLPLCQDEAVVVSYRDEQDGHLSEFLTLKGWDS